MKRVLASLLACSWVISAVFALTPAERLPDAALEARARVLSAQLRCLVCQNQSIDDSDAPLAQDLRRLVRERLVAGESDAAIRDFLVTRYGEFVLLKPSFSSKTFLLWSIPVFALLLGSLAAFGLFRARSALMAGEEASAALNAQEQAALDALLAHGEIKASHRDAT
jgi:cytochrome c-type biogenesis protein CcmH